MRIFWEWSGNVIIGEAFFFSLQLLSTYYVKLTSLSKFFSSNPRQDAYHTYRRYVQCLWIEFCVVFFNSAVCQAYRMWFDENPNMFLEIVLSVWFIVVVADFIIFTMYKTNEQQYQIFEDEYPILKMVGEKRWW